MINSKINSINKDRDRKMLTCKQKATLNMKLQLQERIQRLKKKPPISITTNYIQPKKSTFRHLYSDNYEIGTLARQLCLECKTDIEKSKRLYDHVTQNIMYDYIGCKDGSYLKKDNSSIGIFRNKDGVCAGFSNYYWRLLVEVGVHSRVIHGYVNNDPKKKHAWNEVYYDSNWHIIDTTWKKYDTKSLRKTHTKLRIMYTNC